MVKGDKDVYKRLTAQLNADYNVKEWLQVGTNNSIEHWSTQSVSQMSQYGSVMNSVMTLDPLTPVYYATPDQFSAAMKQAYDAGRPILKDPSNGLYYATSKYITDDSGNPLLQRDRVDRENKGINLRGVIYGNLKPVKGLVVTSRFGYRVGQNNVHSYNTPILLHRRHRHMITTSRQMQIPTSITNGKTLPTIILTSISMTSQPWPGCLTPKIIPITSLPVLPVPIS